MRFVQGYFAIFWVIYLKDIRILSMKKILFSLLISFSLSSFVNTHAQLIKNQNRIKDIERMLQKQQQLTQNGQTPIWSFLNSSFSPDEKQALEFMYAYMPLSDLADYSPSFMDMNVKYALKARSEMVWGKQIPEEVFLHFVLPLRVNNENLDSFRSVMYDELKTRIKGLSMQDAALEVNHWCHEKVTYRGTDIRTSAPLSTVKKSFGRCGEESTFTVTALRTVGIPARQVYTPRWAHTDDNHAWVEVWIDGKWHFLGACEPDAHLDMGWFAEPATRAILVHTRAYGHYYGSEPVIHEAQRFSELNLTSHYAPVKNVTVFVKNERGALVDSSKVNFGLYNYAEFYPVITQYTKHGKVDVTLGLGDLLVWASYKGKFGYSKLSVSETDSLTINLKKTYLDNQVDKYDLIPPKVGKINVNITSEEAKVNTMRLHTEDSIRQNYTNTFKDSAWSVTLATRLGLDPTIVKKSIAKSYGNWDEISSYLEKGVVVNRKYVLPLLSEISDKDFSDTKASILLSHLENTVPDPSFSDDVYKDYVLSPRISNEILTPWRKFLKEAFGAEFAQKSKNDISALRRWIMENIHIDDEANMHSRAPISPEGVYRLRVSDSPSRDIFFVAVCRSMGIPARINQATVIPEYFENGVWREMSFDAQKPSKQLLKGKLHLINGDNLVEPQYYLHFTIGKLIDGEYKTLEFDEQQRLSQFPDQIELEAGYYSLVTGNRQSDGSVLSSVAYFKISPDSLTNLKVELVRQLGNIKSSGKLEPAKLKVQSAGSFLFKTLTEINKDAETVLVIIDPDKEPSKHILNDLEPYKAAFSNLKTKFIYVSTAEKSSGLGIVNTYSLPTNFIAGVDVNDNILNEVLAQYGSTMKDKLPLVLLYDAQGNIYYFSAGYRIGVGEQLLKSILELEKEKPCNVPGQSCTAP